MITELIGLASIIEFAGALIIVGYALLAITLLFRSGGRGLQDVRQTIAEGVLWALSLDVAASLLKILALHTWTQFGTFVVIFSIRTVVKFTIRNNAWRFPIFRRRPSDASDNL